MNKNFIPSVFLFYKPDLISQRILNSKSQWIIYLLEYILCNIQHIGKSETSFNIRLNNHRKDVSNPKAIPVCAQFRIEWHNFIQHAKVIEIEQLTETENVSKTTSKLRLKVMEDFLFPKGLNQELDNV